jgi:hypothetical protein
MFNEPENAPIIAITPATFSVPVGLTPATSRKLSTGKISEADFSCESGCAWITTVTHSDAHHAGRSIHTDATTFNISNYDLVDSIRASITLLELTNPQHGYVLTREEIQARKQLKEGIKEVRIDDETQHDTNPRNALQRQANVITADIKSTLEATGNKDQESRSDRENSTAIKDAIAGYQLMYARIKEQNNPNDPTKTIQTIKLPDISPVFLEILDITKLSDAVRMNLTFLILCRAFLPWPHSTVVQ